MNALIIEDESPAVHRLTTLLTTIEPALRVVCAVRSVWEAVDWLRRSRDIDLIFSDIHLTDGLCFTIFQQVEPPCPIIFTTAYDAYAIQAFKLNSIDYLLKPIVAEELKSALAKYHRLRAIHGSWSIAGQLPPFDMAYLLQSLTSRQPLYRQRFLISSHDTYLTIQTEEVAYFYSEHKITRICLLSGRWFPIAETLEELTDQLNPGQFFRANRQFIVQVCSLGTIHKHFNGKLKVDLVPTPAEPMIVSRERADAFRNWLNR